MPTLDESQRQVAVTAHDLPLACPRPGAPLWARHPKVFIDVLKSATGEAAPTATAALTMRPCASFTTAAAAMMIEITR